MPGDCEIHTLNKIYRHLQAIIYTYKQVSLLQDRLKLAESENDAVFNVHQIRTLQRCNSEVTYNVLSVILRN